MSVFVLAGIAFVAGCATVGIVWALVTAMQGRKKAADNAARSETARALGTLCADVENTLSSFKAGMGDDVSLKQTVATRLETLQRMVHENMHKLDQYHVLYLQHFLKEGWRDLVTVTEKPPATTSPSPECAVAAAPAPMPAMRGDRSEGTGEEAVGEMPAAVESSDSEESFEAPSESAIASPQASEMTYTELDRYGHGDESEETLEQPSVIETSTPPPAEEAASPADSQSPPAPVEEPLESDEEVSFDLSMLSPPAEEEGPAVDAPTFEPSSAEGGEGQPAEVVLDSSSSETKEGQSEEPSFEPSSAEAGEEHAEESVFEPSSTERKEEQSDEVAFEPPSPEVEDESVDAPTFELPPIDLEDDETDTPPFAPVDDAADGSDEPLFESSPIETEDESVDAPTFELPLLETEDDDSEEPIFEPSPTESVDGTVRPVDEGDEGATPRRTEVSTTTDKEQEEELFFDRPTSEESFPMEEETLVMDMETDDDETGDDSDTSRNRPVNISPTDSEFTSDETQVFDRGSLSRLRSEMQTDPVYASPPRQEPSSESGDVDRSSESDDDEEILFDVAPKLEGASSTKPAGSRQTDEPARQAGDDTKAKDESLITGDDIMKQMDSFFGI